MFLILLLILLLVSIFAHYHSTKLNLTNPLIPKYIAFEIFEPYPQKGFIISIGLFVALALKFLKQNLLSLIVCSIIICVYIFTNFNPDFSNYTK
jgi:hypothetical protein